MYRRNRYLLLLFLLTLHFQYPPTEIQGGNIIPNSSSIGEGDRSSWVWEPTTLVTPECTDVMGLGSIDIDRFGNIHLVWPDSSDIIGAGPENDVFYRMWDASTLVWKDIELLTAESTGLFFSRPTIQVDDFGNKHFTWTETANYSGSGFDADVFYLFYNQTLHTWSPIEVISTGSDYQSFGAATALDSHNNLHVAWVDVHYYEVLGEGLDPDLYYRSKNYSTGLWSEFEVVSLQSMLACKNPSMVIDSEDIIHVVWSDLTEIDGDEVYDIFYSFKKPTSAYWSVDKWVSEDCNGWIGSSSVACDKNNNVHIVWSDETDYGFSGSDFDILYRSYNSAEHTWSCIQVVSTRSTEGSYGPAIICDEDGIAHVAWADNTNYLNSGPDSDVFYKTYDINSDVWTHTEVVSTESTEQLGGPRLDTFSNSLYIFWNDGTPLQNSGSDPDIFYRKITGPPDTPHLSPIVPNQAVTNRILLEWEDGMRTTSYYIYRSSDFITSVNGYTPIAITDQPRYEDQVPDEDTYYYSIVAGNSELNSSISNVEHVSIGGRHNKFGFGTIIIIFIGFGILQGLFFYVDTKRRHKLMRKTLKHEKSM